MKTTCRPLYGKNASKFNKKFVINYDEDSDKGYIFKVDVKYPKRPYNFQSELPFFLERMKINKCNKLVWNILDKKCLHKSFKTRIKSWSSTKNVS